MGEVLFIAGLITGLVVPFAFLTGIGRKYWLIMMSVIGVTLGFTEIIAVFHTSKTISQHFWDWSLAHPSTAWIVIGMLFCGWMILLFHLSWKLLTRKK